MEGFVYRLPHVPWLVPVALYIVAAYVGVRWLSKHLANMDDQTKRLTINYAFCTGIGAVFALATGALAFNKAFLMIMIFGGGFNAIAIMSSWKASKVSLSKTSLLSFGDDLVAMLLAMLFLGDAKYLNTPSTVGMLLCVATGVLFWLHSRNKGVENAAFYRNVLLYSGAWGLANFVIRLFALNKLPVGEFIFAWYLGSFVTMAVTLVIERVRDGRSGASTPRPSYALKDYAWVALLALSIAGCLAIQYWALSLAPATAVLPLLLVAEAIVPTVVGLVIFKEAKTFDRAQWAFSALGVTGTILLGATMHVS